MDIWSIVALAVILAGIAFSVWRRYYFTVVASATCIIVFALQQIDLPNDEMSFSPHDLTDPSRLYTVLTSIYAHDPYHLDHLLFNVIGLVFIGLLFEQRIGTRPFAILYLLSGFFGTLAFATYYWNEPWYSVLGASGAISGVLGGFARLYPNERLFFLFLPGYPIRAVYVVFIFVAIQLLLVTGANFNVAWQSHLAGLATGILLAPLVVRLKPESQVKTRISVSALRKLAVTPELKGILKRIESEEVVDVRNAWIGEFISKARCPTCGGPVKITGGSVRCNKGHLL